MHLIAFILLGFAAVGNPGKQDLSPLHAGMYLVYDTGAVVDDIAVEHNDQPVFRCNLPVNRPTKFRSRFRAVSFIQLSPSETNQPVASSCSIQTGKGTTGINTAHLPPFYYIFLFRLTPF